MSFNFFYFTLHTSNFISNLRVIMYKKLSQITTPPNDHPSKLTSSAHQQVSPDEFFLKSTIFAGGSFRTLEAAYGNIDGVLKTCTGYFGGSLKKPSYIEVSEGGTGHTEAVKVVYDSRTITFSSLCDILWDSHDSTNKDYLNFGLSTHQRSVIFYSTEEERREAQESKIRKQMKLNKRIVTKIMSTGNCEFFLAENQHQKYYLQKHYKLCGSLELRSTHQFVESNIACKLNGILGMSEKELIMDELRIFLNSFELPNLARLYCREVIEVIRTKEKK